MVNVNFKSTVPISLDISPSRYQYQAKRHIAHEYFINTSYLINVDVSMHIIHGPRQLVTSSFMNTISYCYNISSFMFYVRICGDMILIRNFHPSRARNYATTIISKLNNFAEVLAVRVHVDVYMATPALRSLTHETLCDTGQRTADSGQRTP